MAWEIDMGRYDILIVGQGLTGSLLAWQLHRAGLNVIVVDPGETNASQVAAGLVTPITGRRWVLTDAIEEYRSRAKALYRDLERFWNTRFWYEHPTLRIYRSEAERELVQRRAQHPGYRIYLGEDVPPGKARFGLAAPFGGRWLLHTAHLDTTALLAAMRRWLQRHNRLCQAHLPLKDLVMNRGGIRWHDFRADVVIFCEGWQVVHNPWFGRLPWQPSRGQILTLECQTRLPPFPVNGGLWLLPEGETRARIGATYRWDRLIPTPDTRDSEELLRKFAALFRQPPRCRIVKEAAGIRPNTLDHHPIVGPHPRFPQLFICNGMGSKATLYAPLVCQQLCDHLLYRTPLPARIHLQRHRDRLLD